MEKITYSMIQVLVFAIAAILVSTHPAKEDNASSTTSTPPKGNKDEVVKSWPKVFYLSMDPNDPIVCYSGIKFNFTDNENKTSEGDKNNQQIFTLSNDPLYPVTCRKGPVPVSLIDTYTIVEEDNGGNITNVTCIRRDYENNVSAIFIHKAGPIHTAWNIFNSSIPYGFMTATNVTNIDEKKVLKEYDVDCAKYGIDTGDKGLCPGLAASLCG